MKGARINFGVPNSEYVLLANDNGEATSLKNQDTGTEYIGGDSDFTIANVTITNEDTYNVIVPIIIEADGLEYISADGPSSLNGDYQVPLYKGNALFMTVEPLTITTTGNISPLVEGEVYLITGDCTITISA